MTPPKSAPHRRPRNNRARFFKYVSHSALIAILETLCLKWSSPLLFNDPFDTPRILKLPFAPELLSAEVGAALAQRMRKGQTVTNERLRDTLESLRSVDSAETVNAIAHALESSGEGRMSGSVAFLPLRLAWFSLVLESRILCLAESRESLPMWAHYAAQHSGAVLEFECRDDLDSAYRLAQPMVYHPRLPTLPPKSEWVRMMLSNEELDLDAFFAEYFLVKHADWSYEREWRVISTKRESESGLESYWGFDERELVSVTLGSACSAATEESVRKLLNEPEVKHVRLDQARIDHLSQAIVFDRPRRA